MTVSEQIAQDQADQLAAIRAVYEQIVAGIPGYDETEDGDE